MVPGWRPRLVSLTSSTFPCIESGSEVATNDSIGADVAPVVMLSDVAVLRLVVEMLVKKATRRKVRHVVAASQLVAAEAFMDSQAGKLPKQQNRRLLHLPPLLFYRQNHGQKNKNKKVTLL